MLSKSLLLYSNHEYLMRSKKKKIKILFFADSDKYPVLFRFWSFLGFSGLNFPYLVVFFENFLSTFFWNFYIDFSITILEICDFRKIILSSKIIYDKIIFFIQIFFYDQGPCVYFHGKPFWARYNQLKIPKTERQKKFYTFCRYGSPPKIRSRYMNIYTYNSLF